MSPSSPCVHPPHMEKKGIIGQKCVLCPPLLGESLSFSFSSNRAMPLLEFSKFKISENDFFPISSLQSPKKFEFSEFFSEKIRFQKFPKNFFGKIFPKYKSPGRGPSQRDGTRWFCLFFVRRTMKRRNPIYINIYIYIYIGVFSDSAPGRTKKNKNKCFFLKKEWKKGLSFFQKKMFFSNRVFSKKLIFWKKPLFSTQSFSLKFPHNAPILQGARRHSHYLRNFFPIF